MSGQSETTTENPQETLDRLEAEERQAMVDRAEKFLGSVHPAEEAVQEASRNALRALRSLRDPGRPEPVVRQPGVRVEAGRETAVDLQMTP